VRLVPTVGAGYPRLAPGTDDSRFADQFAAVQGIVTGNAIDDPGLFVRNISSNLNDPRYLPFENAGAISRWKIELPATRNSLDLSTVTDVKLHLHYSAPTTLCYRRRSRQRLSPRIQQAANQSSPVRVLLCRH